jgi:hypothetical protein
MSKDIVRSTWPRGRRQRNMANWLWARERNPALDDVKWLRVENLLGLELPQPVVLVTGAFDPCSAYAIAVCCPREGWV